ncbi:MAG: FprA family A-type flavoprotein, partial [Leptolyngbyaceae cyanobacterium CRU_2_3]|nr:FprA family A-type flavoprotein [Leptolyngbyaceae cyanobacterium CRU_2_3]
MVALAERSLSRLTLQVQEIAADTTTIRSLDWDRDRFDIEFELENGTTYNSFLIRGDKVALVDTSHEKFRQLYLEKLADLIDLAEIDYLIVSHTEPDHSGLIQDILQRAPHIVVVGSKVAMQFLDDQVHQSFERMQVKNGDRLDLGQGHELEFVSAPNLHWPDTILSFDHKTKVLFTCDVFGLHFCDDHTYDEDLEILEADYKLYYDCLMGPNARSVLAALKRMKELPEITTIATGHGPLLHYNVTELVGRYRDWSQTQAKAETTVALFYASDYGYGEELAQAIAQGIHKTGVAVELLDLKYAEPHEISEMVSLAAGVVIGMPPQSGEFANTTRAALGTILAATHAKQTVGLFEVGGGDDESVYPLRNQFQEIGVREGFVPILIKETPNKATFQLCREAGTDLGQWLTRDRAVKQMKSLDNELDKALG